MSKYISLPFLLLTLYVVDSMVCGSVSIKQKNKQCAELNNKQRKKVNGAIAEDMRHLCHKSNPFIRRFDAFDLQIKSEFSDVTLDIIGRNDGETKD